MFVVTQWIALLVLLIVGAPMFVPLGPHCCAFFLFLVSPLRAALNTKTHSDHSQDLPAATSVLNYSEAPQLAAT
jgi:phosphoribosyl 1,2-cyclic phosphodiesterase